MITPEGFYVVRELEDLNRLFSHLVSGDIKHTFFLRDTTLDYAKKNASYFDDSGDEGIVRLYVNGDKVTIVFSKKTNEYCESLYPIELAFLDSSDNVYHFILDSTSQCNFWLIFLYRLLCLGPKRLSDKTDSLFVII